MSLKRKLEFHFKSFDKTKISPDPVEIPHKYSRTEDIEITAFISALFSYGNVKSILDILNKITDRLEENPYEKIISSNPEKLIKLLDGVYYRFYSSDDIKILFLLLQTLLKKYSSIENLFMKYYVFSEASLKMTLSSVMNIFLAETEKINIKSSTGLRYMFPDPYKGSACKRINLFLRWMIRKDEIDFGLWKNIPSSKLVIPVDTHIANISRELGLTEKKNISWSMAEEITENLKKYDKDDPVKYDFALCHIGMRKIQF